MKRPSTRGRLIEMVSLVALVSLFAALALTSLRRKSMTFDEPVNISSGCHWWSSGGDTSVGDLHHPPLSHLPYGVPLLGQGVTPLSQVVAERAPMLGLPPDYRIDDQGMGFMFARAFVFENTMPGPVMVNRARTVAVGFGVLFVLATWWAARGVGGPVVGVVAAALVALSPNVLAHARLTLGDIPQAAFTVLFLGGLYRLTCRCTVSVSVLTGLALGAAVGTKVSSLVLVPVGVGLVVVALVVRRPFVPSGWFRKLGRRWAVVASAVLVTAMALSVPWGLYARSDAGGTRGELARKAALRMLPTEHQASESEVPELSSTQRLVATGFRWMPLPIEYANFIAWVAADARSGRPTLAFGHRTTGGQWTYFPGTILLKTPLPVLILAMWSVGLAMLGAGAWAWRRLKKTDRAEIGEAEFAPAWPVVFFGSFVVLYLGLAMRSSFNIGHRHLLPLFGPAAVVVSVLVMAWWRRRKRMVSSMLVVMALWQLVVVISVWPNYLSYFNPIAGGPDQGYRYYVGSNFDWGQDLPALARYQEENRTGPLRLHYFGSADPAAYGVKVAPPERGERFEARPGVYAISATVWMGVWNSAPGDPLPFPFLRNRQPRARVNNTIFIFDSPADDPPE